MGAEWDVFERCGSAVIPDTSEREHLSVKRAVEYSAFLMICAIDSDTECALEVIDGNQFPRDTVLGALGRKLAGSELEPLGLLFLLLAFLRFAFVVWSDWTIGIGTEARGFLRMDEG